MKLVYSIIIAALFVGGFVSPVDAGAVTVCVPVRPCGPGGGPYPPPPPPPCPYRVCV